MSDVFLARQPILDHTRSVTAYELLYRDGEVEAARVDDAEAATAQVALNALTEIGLDRVVGEQQAWINVTPDFLAKGLALGLPRKRVVLELREPEVVDRELIDLLTELRGSGFGLALDDCHYRPELAPLLGPVFESVKLDLARLGRDRLAADARALRQHDVRVVAEKVESHEDFELAHEAGCQLFQGYFFCRPELVKGRSVAPNAAVMVRLAARLQDPRLELSELDRLISSDVALSYRLLRYINSAYFALRQQVSSVMHAVALLGIENVKRWAALTTFAAIEDKPRELFTTALIRARFCQTAGEDIDGPPAERFTIGLFSVVDALTDTDMKKAVSLLPFPARIRDALVDHSGPGRLISCVQAIEQGHFNRVARQLSHPARHYTQALAWANDIVRELKSVET
jgi:c-di-GMP phosphodiesterase